MDKGKTRLSSEQIHAQIRDDILAGYFRPGEKLKFAELQERYGVGVGKMREALIRLVEQGLAQSEPMVGFSVADVTIDDMADLTEARSSLEGLVFHRAIESGSMEWESHVVAAHHQLARTQMYANEDHTLMDPAWVDAHLKFHLALLDGCPNRRLKDIAVLLRDSGELYRTWSQTSDHGGDRDVPAEHQAITQAVLDRDADRGQRLLAEHIQRTFELMRLTLDLQQETGISR